MSFGRELVDEQIRSQRLHTYVRPRDLILEPPSGNHPYNHIVLERPRYDSIVLTAHKYYVPQLVGILADEISEAFTNHGYSVNSNWKGIINVSRNASQRIPRDESLSIRVEVDVPPLEVMARETREVGSIEKRAWLGTLSLRHIAAIPRFHIMGVVRHEAGIFDARAITDILKELGYQTNTFLRVATIYA